MIDDIVHRNGLVPVADHFQIHFENVDEWPSGIVQGSFLGEMRIGSEERIRRRLFEFLDDVLQEFFEVIPVPDFLHVESAFEIIVLFSPVWKTRIDAGSVEPVTEFNIGSECRMFLLYISRDPEDDGGSLLHRYIFPGGLPEQRLIPVLFTELHKIRICRSNDFACKT